MNPKRTYFNWSSGKDASMALHALNKNADFNVDLLLTSTSASTQRVSMHGLHIDILERQAKAIGLPLELIQLPENASMEDYGRIMSETVQGLSDRDYKACGFGDIFLEDLKKYREEQLAPFPITPQFPLWKQDTAKLIHHFVESGFNAKVVCMNASLLDESFLGREIDHSFLADLPQNVDPCGENGEFHTFCYDGPIFNQPVPFELGERVFKEYDDPTSSGKVGFWFVDVV